MEVNEIIETNKELIQQLREMHEKLLDINRKNSELAQSSKEYSYKISAIKEKLDSQTNILERSTLISSPNPCNDKKDSEDVNKMFDSGKESQLESELSHLKEEKQHLSDQLSARNNQIEELNKNYEVLNRGYEELQNKCNYEQEAKEHCEKEIKELESRLNEVKLDSIVLEEELDNAAKAVEQYKSTIDKLQKELTAKNVEIASLEAASKTEDNDFLPINCSDEVKEYAKISVNVISIIHRMLNCLDQQIKNFYDDNDEANYFYVRRRMKVNESTGNLEALRKYEAEIQTIAKYGCVFPSSDLASVINSSTGTELESLKYFLYIHLFKDVLGASFILLKEMRGMGRYVGISDVPNAAEVIDMISSLKEYTRYLGYDIVDVELFEELPLVDNIVCVEANDISLDGLASDGIYEIVKLAVNYGLTNEKTEVKIKR